MIQTCQISCLQFQDQIWNRWVSSIRYASDESRNNWRFPQRDIPTTHTKPQTQTDTDTDTDTDTHTWVSQVQNIGNILVVSIMLWNRETRVVLRRSRRRDYIKRQISLRIMELTVRLSCPCSIRWRWFQEVGWYLYEIVLWLHTGNVLSHGF